MNKKKTNHRRISLINSRFSKGIQFEKNKHSVSKCFPEICEKIDKKSIIFVYSVPLKMSYR